MKKIAICIPHNYPNFQKPFVQSLLGVIQSFERYNAATGNKYELNLLMQNGFSIDSMREQLAESAIASGADFLMWMDTDMQFPPDLIARMVRHFEDNFELEAVTGLYTWKQPPFMPHVYTSYHEDKGNFSVAGAFPLKDTFPVVAAGYGCLMIRSSKYGIIKRPWFKMETDGQDIVCGEDMYFFKKALPINMICDPTISCIHYTITGFGIDQYLQYNRFEKDENGNIKIDDEKLKKAADEHTSRIKRLQK